MEPISDDQIRQACSTLGLRPAGLIPEDRDSIGLPKPGPLGLAAGHPSPGWQYLRDLIDEVQQTVPFGPLPGMTPASRRASIAASAQYLAGIKPWAEAMVCVADLGIEHVHDVQLSTVYGNVAELAYTLLVRAGRLVSEEVFAKQLAVTASK